MSTCPHNHDWCTPDAFCWPCTLDTHRAQAAARLAEIDARIAQQRDWYRATGHCGACGQPGGYCQCRTDCACSDLHPVGSGLREDALAQFLEVPISDEQGELFG